VANATFLVCTFAIKEKKLFLRPSKNVTFLHRKVSHFSLGTYLGGYKISVDDENGSYF
jgi:hypothetical protein